MGARVSLRGSAGPVAVPVIFRRKPGDLSDAGIISAISYDGRWFFQPDGAGAWVAVFTPTGHVSPGASLWVLRKLVHGTDWHEVLRVQDAAAMARPCVDRDGQCGGLPAVALLDAPGGPWPVCVGHSDGLRAAGKAVRAPGEWPTVPRPAGR
jgi:hypothetical protein